MTPELVLYLIVAAVAIFAAAFMLISRNAVHSALFLVINMISLAFFYLMLNAPFLAMVQITVYAGAIMVLFMFVIMLLGADKLSETPTTYRWLPLGAVVLTTLFLVTAFVAIIQGRVDLLRPVAHAPLVRVVHAAANTPPVDVYLNNDKLANAVADNANTEYLPVKAGDYNALVFPTKADGTASDPAKDAPALAIPLKLAADTATTLIAAQDRLIVVPQDLNTILEDNHLRYTAVNAFPGDASANLLQLDPTNLNPTTPEDVKRYVTIAAPGLKYGDVSSQKVLASGPYTLSWQLGGQRVLTLPEQRLDANTNQLFILAPENGAVANTLTPTALRISQRTAWPFGSPQGIGERLFSVYLLPFELVSLLLLAAMVGAIILTREEVIKRERKRLVVSPQVKRLNQAATTLAIGTESTPESATD